MGKNLQPRRGLGSQTGKEGGSPLSSDTASAQNGARRVKEDSYHAPRTSVPSPEFFWRAVQATRGGWWRSSVCRERLALHETEVGHGSSDGEGAPCEREAKQSRRPDPREADFRASGRRTTQRLLQRKGRRSLKGREEADGATEGGLAGNGFWEMGKYPLP